MRFGRNFKINTYVTYKSYYPQKVILDAGDFIRQVHSDSSKIVAVSNKGALFNVYVENSVVKYTTLKLPSNRGKSIFISSKEN